MSNGNKDLVQVDFTGIEDNYNIPEGWYQCIVEDVEQKTAKESQGKYLAWKFSIIQGENKNKSLFFNTSLQPQSLFVLKGLLHALGVEVPSGAFNIQLSALLGKVLSIRVGAEEYQGKIKPIVMDYASVETALPEIGQ